MTRLPHMVTSTDVKPAARGLSDLISCHGRAQTQPEHPHLGYAGQQFQRTKRQPLD